MVSAGSNVIDGSSCGPTGIRSISATSSPVRNSQTASYRSLRAGKRLASEAKYSVWPVTKESLMSPVADASQYSTTHTAVTSR